MKLERALPTLAASCAAWALLLGARGVRAEPMDPAIERLTLHVDDGTGAKVPCQLSLAGAGPGSYRGGQR